MCHIGDWIDFSMLSVIELHWLCCLFILVFFYFSLTPLESAPLRLGNPVLSVISLWITHCKLDKTMQINVKVKCFNRVCPNQWKKHIYEEMLLKQASQLNIFVFNSFDLFQTREVVNIWNFTKQHYIKTIISSSIINVYKVKKSIQCLILLIII